jgi:hypothetical protein
MNLLSQNLEVSSILGVEGESVKPDVEVDFSELALEQDDLPTYEEYMEPTFLKVEREALKEKEKIKAKFLPVDEMKKINPNYVPRVPPRRITGEDANQLLKTFPPILSVSEEASRVATSQYKDFYFERMVQEEFALEPSEEAFDLFVKLQNAHATQAQPKDGRMMGNIAAFGESCANTQATLKTKKKTGASLSTALKGGLQNIKSLLHAQDSPAEKTMTIHFNEKVTKRQIIDLEAQLVGTTLADLIDREHTVISKLSKEYETNGSDLLPRNIAHDVYLPKSRSVNLDNPCIRLALKKDEMFSRQLTPWKIAKIATSHAEIDRLVRLIPSSFNDAFIDIFTTTEVDTQEDEEDGPNDVTQLLEVELYYNILEKLRSVTLQGIPEIKRISPKSVGYHQLFRGVRPPKRTEQAERILEYDLTICANNNYPDPGFVEDSLRKAGIKIKEKFYREFTGRLYGYSIGNLPRVGVNVTKERLGPLAFDFEIYKTKEGILLVRSEPTDLTEFFEQNQYEIIRETEEGYLVRPPRCRTLRDAFFELDLVDREYVYAVTDGSNMEKVVLYPWVDTSRLTTNSIPEMFRYFGIEVARNYFIYDYIANKEAVNANARSAYTYIIADDMTYWGEPLGTTFHENAKKKDNDFITLSTISHPNQVYASYAKKSGVASITSNPVSVTATGEIFAGTNMPGILRPTKESVLKRLRDAKEKKIVVRRNVAQVVRNRVEEILLENVDKLQTMPSQKSIVLPSLLPSPEVEIVPVKIDRTGSTNQKEYSIDFVVSNYTRDLVEGTEAPARDVDTEKTEKISLSIIQEQDCIFLLNQKRKMTTVVRLPVVKKRPTLEFTDYLDEDDEEQEEEFEFFGTLKAQTRYVPSAGIETELII